ncbi:MAG: AAA family ATPase [Oscillospiraceae bacterium]|nr:AAA family ATPase [Oscillospiraceae bacterium]
MSIKINKLEIENVKRVKAVKLEPSASGLTIIGGNNNQGKTSVLDAIAWALGGDNYRPSDPARQGSAIPPYLHVVMSNGLVVERKGKNSDLKVTDPSGEKAGQALLNSFVEKLALDLPKFMEANDADKAKTLLNIIGVGPQLQELERKEKEIYQERLYIGRTADQKKKFADEQVYYPDAPAEPVSAADLIREQQEILARNGQRQQWIRQHDDMVRALDMVDGQIEGLEEKLRQLKGQREDLAKRTKEAEKTPRELEMETTEELERSISQIDDINRKVRANLDKEKAEEDARTFAAQYEKLTAELESIRHQKKELLNHADLPLPELTVEEGKLLYKRQQWDNMSGSDQLKVATAIVRKLNPNCGFVLIDKLEQMDLDTLKAFGQWLEQEDLQVIATRVSSGEECSIIISDGYALQSDKEEAPAAPVSWKKGEF